jgi:hypothetical protein
VIFVAAKKVGQLIFSPLSFVAVFGSGIRDPGSRIRDGQKSGFIWKKMLKKYCFSSRRKLRWMTEVGGEADRRRTAEVSGTIGTGIATGTVTVTAGTEIGIGIEAEIGTGAGSGMTGVAAAAGTGTTRRRGAAAGQLLSFPAYFMYSYYCTHLSLSYRYFYKVSTRSGSGFPLI